MKIGTEAAQFPEKEYINGIFLAVWLVHSFKILGFSRRTCPTAKTADFDSYSRAEKASV